VPFGFLERASPTSYNLLQHSTHNFDLYLYLNYHWLLDISAALSRHLLKTPMTRRRTTKDPKTIPLAMPSATSPRPAPAKPLIEIPEDEKWRLINQTGILKSAALNSEPSTESLQGPALEEETLSTGDEIFNAILLIIPFSAILLLMEVYAVALPLSVYLNI
jgi:hypothetical protein